jgi:hypothetical protein
MNTYFVYGFEKDLVDSGINIAVSMLYDPINGTAEFLKSGNRSNEWIVRADDEWGDNVEKNYDLRIVEFNSKELTPIAEKHGVFVVPHDLRTKLFTKEMKAEYTKLMANITKR